MSYEITLSKHPEHGFGTWWEVSEVRPEAEWFRGSYSGYAVTAWGARRKATRLARQLARSGESVTFHV